ncbi:MAG: hypothetical protein EBE86_014640 [Hormoscilla sp. GUM202]|nr:hypothetical protein [Hormoscilla sp. GM7CHS1pb]MBO1348543.1 hypothetical protein [Hormoscilla sp. GUM202]
MHDLYGIIEKIKKAPSMYLGRNSIICLQAFLSGYSVAKYELGEQETEQERDFMEFPEWIRQRFKVQTSQSWANIILFYSEDERKALDNFFDLFEEFISRYSVRNTLKEKSLKSRVSGDRAHLKS